MAYLIIDVCGYVLLQGPHGILHPQVGVGPQQRLIRGTVSEQQEYPTWKREQRDEICSECRINCSKCNLLPGSAHENARKCRVASGQGPRNLAATMAPLPFLCQIRSKVATRRRKSLSDKGFKVMCAGCFLREIGFKLFSVLGTSDLSSGKILRFLKIGPNYFLNFNKQLYF